MPPPPASAPSHASPDTPHGSRRVVAVLVAQVVLGLAVMTICLPSMQDWSAQLGVPQATVQLTFSAYALAFGALQLVWGPLSDRRGRRPVMLAGLLLLIVGLVLAALANDATTLIVARFLQGSGAAAGIVAGRASIQDLFTGPQRTRVLGYTGMAMGITPPLATVVGGQLHERVGWASNFVLMSVLTLALLVVSWRALPRDAPRASLHDAGASPSNKSPSNKSPWWRTVARDFAGLLRQRAFLPAAMVIGMSTATFYAFLAAAPLVLGSYGVRPAQLGWFVMIVPLSYILGNFITTRLAHRLDGVTLMHAGQAVALLGIVLTIVLHLLGLRTPLAFAAPLSLLGIGHGLLIPTATTRAVAMAAGAAGAAAAVVGVLQQASGAASGWVVGFLSHDGPVNLGWMMMATTVASMIMVRLSTRPRVDAAQQAR
jgi:MFS transporter, DHA1 family, multidrug resistance protein